MQELEKILEEIERLKEMYKTSGFSLLDKGSLPCEYDKSDIESAKVQALSETITIILKHMNDGWIPVEERLPEESLNSVIGWDEYRERCCFVQYYGGKWILGNREPVNIIAWRPLPDPYHPERSGNEP